MSARVQQMNHRWFGIIALVFAGLVSIGPAHAAGNIFLIIETSTSAYEVGGVLKGEDTVTLSKGEKVTVISDSGQKVEIDGPIQNTVAILEDRLTKAAPAKPVLRSNIIASISGLFKGNRGSALTRSFGSGGPMPTPWHLDITRTGKTCFRKDDVARLWRPGPTPADTINIVNAATGETADLSIASGERILDWPLQVRLEDGVTYTVTRRSNNATISANIILMSEDFPTRMHEAAWMTDNGCDPQARQLIVTSEIDLFINELTASGKL